MCLRKLKEPLASLVEILRNVFGIRETREHEKVGLRTTVTTRDPKKRNDSLDNGAVVRRGIWDLASQVAPKIRLDEDMQEAHISLRIIENIIRNPIWRESNHL